jgi:hypothetical protein
MSEKIDKVKELMKDATQDELVEFMMYFKSFLQNNLKGMVRRMR